ncbi:hypothetical protein BDW68DRAFT_167541 [Aspergillus falconensis]
MRATNARLLITDSAVLAGISHPGLPGRLVVTFYLFLGECATSVWFPDPTLSSSPTSAESVHEDSGCHEHSRYMQASQPAQCNDDPG